VTVGGITYNDLADYSDEVTTSAWGWAMLLAGVEESASYFQSAAIAPVGQVWTGTAAQLAAGRFETTKGGLIKNASNYSEIRNVLLQLNSELSKLSGELVNNANAIAGGFTFDGINVPEGYLEVSADGIVQRYLGPGHLPDDPKFDAIIPDLQAILDKQVSAANTADAKAAKALQEYFPKADFTQQAPTTAAWKTVSSYGSLWQIAQTEYGDGNMWTKIWDANQATFKAHGVTDPDVIPTGLSLKVPPLVSSLGPAATDRGYSPLPDSAVPTPPAHATTTSGSQESSASSSSSASAIPLGAGEI
jgi:hypothetical protein